MIWKDVFQKGKNVTLSPFKGFSVSLSLGELNSTMMIAEDPVRTLPLEIYGAISGYRFSYASAVAVILLLLSATTFLVVEWSLGRFGLLKQTNKGFL